MKRCLLVEFKLIVNVSNDVVILILIPLLSFTICYNEVWVTFQRWIVGDYVFVYHRGNTADNVIFIKTGSKIFWNILIDCFNIRPSIANFSNVPNNSFYLLNKKCHLLKLHLRPPSYPRKNQTKKRNKNIRFNRTNISSIKCRKLIKLTRHAEITKFIHFALVNYFFGRNFKTTQANKP